VIDAADSSETFVYFYWMTLHDIPEDVSVICEVYSFLTSSNYLYCGFVLFVWPSRHLHAHTVLHFVRYNVQLAVFVTVDFFQSAFCV